MSVKLKRKEVVYCEINEKYILNVNGKEVIAFHYTKQDPEFDCYEGDYEIIDKEKLTEEEQDEVMDFIMEGI